TTEMQDSDRPLHGQFGAVVTALATLCNQLDEDVMVVRKDEAYALTCATDRDCEDNAHALATALHFAAQDSASVSRWLDDAHVIHGSSATHGAEGATTAAPPPPDPQRD